MNFFKRARTPEELVFKCCNAYEELAKAMPQRQAVRRPAPDAAPAAARADAARRGARPSTTW
jgi:hypothetical protein